MEDILTGSQFFAGENAHLSEEGDVLLGGELGNCFDTRVNAPDTTVSEHLLVGRVVVVSVEDDLPVLLEGFTGNVGGVCSSIDLVGEFTKLLGRDGVENGVHQGDVLGGSDGTEFETGSSVRERRSSVSVLGGNLEGKDFAGSEVQSLLFGNVLLGRTRHEGLQVAGHIVTKVSGDNGGRGLAGTQTEVISWGGDSHAHEVTVFIDGGNNSSHDNRESKFISSCLKDGFGVEDLDTGTSGDGPVIVLSGSVDVVEGLFLEKSGKSVLGGGFLNDLHNHDVLVNLSGVGSEERSKLKLVGGDLSMTGLEWNSQAPALVLDFLHASQGGSGAGERSHVVVAHFLSTGGILAHDGTAGHLKIGASVVLVARDKENFLFQTNVCNDTTGDVQAQLREETACLPVDGSVGSEKRGLFVESSTVVRDKGGGDEDCVASAENGRGSVDSEVSTGLVGSTKSTIGVGRTVGFSLDESLSLEILLDFHVGVEFQHHVLHLTGQTVTDSAGSHRLEPVAVNIRTTINGPIENSVSYSVGMVGGPCRVLQDITAGAVLLKIIVGDLPGENILAKIFIGGKVCHSTGTSAGCLSAGEGLDGSRCGKHGR
mmetsp:Transcript_55703/g.156288  ORF Transcript_55703/g.156288 Transcript_55703/m.156288 type:complete len:597 (-) Transcript_55703:34-1824(-)